MTDLTERPDSADDPVDDWTAGVPRLILRRCEQCGRYRYLPRVRCDACGSSAATAVRAGGEGLCVALTVLYVTADRTGDPVRLALAELDEGPIAMGRAEAGVQTGVRVRVQFPQMGVGEAVVPTFVRTEVPQPYPLRAAPEGADEFV